MSELKLSADARSEFGKGAARRLRRAGKVPAVIYGHGTDPQHIALPGHQTMMALKAANALLEISVDSAPATLALVKDIQRDPIKNVIEHVDLVIVRRGERVQVEIPVHVVGEAAPQTLVSVDSPTVLLDVEATTIPEHVEVNIEGLEAGTQISAADLVLPSGASVAVDPETLIVNVTAQVSAEALEADLAGDSGAGSEAAADDAASND